MAGRGPAPKPADRRARRNKDDAPSIKLRLVRAGAPELPDDMGWEWHPRTINWWQTWANDQLSRDFTAVDWSFLLDTALMHHMMWAKGYWTLAAEVRLRVAKYGATPEDRARLRIVYADADEAEHRNQLAGISARERRGPLRAAGFAAAELEARTGAALHARARAIDAQVAAKVGAVDVVQWLLDQRAAGVSVTKLAEATERSRSWVRTRLTMAPVAMVVGAADVVDAEVVDDDSIGSA